MSTTIALVLTAVVLALLGGGVLGFAATLLWVSLRLEQRAIELWVLGRFNEAEAVQTALEGL